MYLTRGHLIGLTLAALVLLGCEIPPAPPSSPKVGDITRCREFSVTSMIGGQPERTVGTACQQADGSWRVRP